MNNSNHNTQRPELQDDIIELGVASVETRGDPPIGTEPFGLDAGVGITE